MDDCNVPFPIDHSLFGRSAHTITPVAPSESETIISLQAAETAHEQARSLFEEGRYTISKDHVPAEHVIGAVEPPTAHSRGFLRRGVKRFEIISDRYREPKTLRSSVHADRDSIQQGFDAVWLCKTSILDSQLFMSRSNDLRETCEPKPDRG